MLSLCCQSDSTLTAKLRLAWLLRGGENFCGSGAGKTTLAQHLTSSFFCTYVDLRNCSQSQPFGLLLKEAELISRTNRPEKAPRVLVLDALDKMTPGAAHSTVVSNLREIRSQATGYTAVIITARTAFFRTHTDEQLGARHVLLQPIPPDAVLRLALDDALGPEFQAAVAKSNRLIDLATKPLLYQLLIRLIREGHDISKIEDDEDIFALLTDHWLSRDAPDALLDSKVRMTCMQCLAVQALATGGAPVSYASIDSLVVKIFGSLTSSQLEQMNADLRICGFLRRIGDDLFDFEHATFYEYCVARTVFHDLQHDDLATLEIQQFTDQVISFIVRRATKTGRQSEVGAAIRRSWGANMNSVARVNLMRLYTALHGECGVLDLTGVVIESQNLNGVKYRGGKQNCRNVIFRACNFAGSEWGRIQADGWCLENCFVASSQFGFARFELARITDTRWVFEKESYLRFTNCDWLNSWIVIHGGVAEIQGGTLQQCVLNSEPRSDGIRKRKDLASWLRFCDIKMLAVGDSLEGWRIESCALDPLSLHALSNLRPGHRPSLSKEIARAVDVWRTSPGSSFGVRMPATSSSGSSGSMEKRISESKRRKIERQVRKAIRAERKPRDGE